MNPFQSILRNCAYAMATVVMAAALSAGQAPANNTQAGSEPQQNPSHAPKAYDPALVQEGSAQFRQDCSFCHGRNAGGGESGPDLTRSKLVADDVDGEKIGAVVRSGRPDKGMPPFDRTDAQVSALVAFIHTQRNNALAHTGGRKGVDAADLQTGNVEEGKKYFEGAGGCAKCHSATGDLAGIASRHKGLELEERMLYPKNAKARVSVTQANHESISGKLAYLDEFTVGLIDESGSYRSWRTRDVQYKLDRPVDAHVEQFSKYTDDDIHNLMAYLQTLR